MQKQNQSNNNKRNELSMPYIHNSTVHFGAQSWNLTPQYIVSKHLQDP